MDGCVSASRVAATVFLLCAGLAACGGGGGGGTPPTSDPPTSSTPTSTPTPTPASFTGSGTLVDHESGAPIAGMYVGLAPNTVAATPLAQPTTNASGQFTVSANSAGTYLLVIGDGANNRPVIHDLVTLAAGANTLKAPHLGPAPGATPNPIEQSDNFRLTTLTTMEQSCLAYENTVRAAHSLSVVTSDEWLTEQNRGYWTVAAATNSAPAWPQVLGFTDETGSGADCTTLINNAFVLGAAEAYSPLLWFAGDAGGAHNVATDQSMADPRGPLPTPTPNNPPIANPWP